VETRERRHPMRRPVVGALFMVLVACTSSPPGGTSSSPTSGHTGTSGSPSVSLSPSPSRPTSPPPGTTTIGYVGCSNSAAAVNGYHLVGGQLMWPFIRNYGGGTVTRWASGIGKKRNQYWAAFTKQEDHLPAHIFWLQLCARSTEDQDNDEGVLAIIAEIRRRVPDAVVYISALNDWVAPHVCAICGPDGPAHMEADTADIIATGEALEGPHLGALTVQCQVPECGVSSAGATSQNNQVVADGCHPNASGQRMLGESLERFFG
jgi:hypothetical protein